jgi:hypothetical protein
MAAIRPKITHGVADERHLLCISPAELAAVWRNKVGRLLGCRIVDSVGFKSPHQLQQSTWQEQTGGHQTKSNIWFCGRPVLPLHQPCQSCSHQWGGNQRLLGFRIAHLVGFRMTSCWLQTSTGSRMVASQSKNHILCDGQVLPSPCWPNRKGIDGSLPLAAFVIWWLSGIICSQLQPTINIGTPSNPPPFIGTPSKTSPVVTLSPDPE